MCVIRVHLCEEKVKRARENIRGSEPLDGTLQCAIFTDMNLTLKISFKKFNKF